MPRLDPVGSPAPSDAFARAPARRQAAPGVYSPRDHGDRRHARIQRDARAGGVTKEYLAVVRGLPRPSEGVIRLPLQHDPADRRRIVVDEAGRPSQTRYRVVSSEHGCSLVRCELVTGRTHQIGVHLAASGWPISVTAHMAHLTRA